MFPLARYLPYPWRAFSAWTNTSPGNSWDVRRAKLGVVIMIQVGKLDRGRTYAPKFPGVTRRDFTRNRVKGPKFSGARAETLQNVQKGPKCSAAARREIHNQISPDILNITDSPFFPTWGERPPRAGNVGTTGRSSLPAAQKRLLQDGRQAT